MAECKGNSKWKWLTEAIIITVLSLVAETVWQQKSDFSTLKVYTEINTKNIDKISSDIGNIRKDVTDLKIELSCINSKIDDNHKKIAQGDNPCPTKSKKEQDQSLTRLSIKTQENK